MKAMWNERYQQKEFQYGTNPNDFMASELAHLTPGRILFPGAGEGRDAVYAAKLGWETHAFDLSEQGQAKAIRLALRPNGSLAFKTNTLFSGKIMNANSEGIFFSIPFFFLKLKALC